jgi:hypothetical protein
VVLRGEKRRFFATEDTEKHGRLVLKGRNFYNPQRKLGVGNPHLKDKPQRGVTKSPWRVVRVCNSCGAWGSSVREVCRPIGADRSVEGRVPPAYAGGYRDFAPFGAKLRGSSGPSW